MVGGWLAKIATAHTAASDQAEIVALPVSRRGHPFLATKRPQRAAGWFPFGAPDPQSAMALDLREI